MAIIIKEVMIATRIIPAGTSVSIPFRKALCMILSKRSFNDIEIDYQYRQT